MLAEKKYQNKHSKFNTKFIIWRPIEMTWSAHKWKLSFHLIFQPLQPVTYSYVLHAFPVVFVLLWKLLISDLTQLLNFSISFPTQLAFFWLSPWLYTDIWFLPDICIKGSKGEQGFARIKWVITAVVSAAFIYSHGLRTPNEGINQRNLKFWAHTPCKSEFDHK